MKHVIALFIATQFLTGCGSSHEITREWTVEKSQQYVEISHLGWNHRADITVQNDFITEEFEGDSVSVRSDSVRWIDPDSKQSRSAPTENLRRILFVERATSALVGTAIGIAPGAVILASSLGRNDKNASMGQGIGAILALGGGVVGGGLGAIIGRRSEFIFPTR